MDIDFRESFEPKNRREWRAWLETFHGEKSQVWLIFNKKHTGIASPSYDEVLEEAICFGWIDGLKRRVDADKYTYRFTPRKKGSKWSPRNMEIAEKMISTGKMTKTGLESYKQRSDYGDHIKDLRAAGSFEVPSDILEALRNNPLAYHNYRKMAPGHRKNYIRWIIHAKRITTRHRRISETIQRLENNLKPGV